MVLQTIHPQPLQDDKERIEIPVGDDALVVILNSRNRWRARLSNPSGGVGTYGDTYAEAVTTLAQCLRRGDGGEDQIALAPAIEALAQKPQSVPIPSGIRVDRERTPLRAIEGDTDREDVRLGREILTILRGAEGTWQAQLTNRWGACCTGCDTRKQSLQTLADCLRAGRGGIEQISLAPAVEALIR